MQGTVHRRLLEDREEELKVGAVLLLKQVRLITSISFNFNDGNCSVVFELNPRGCTSISGSLCGQVGVFSPSHRNHYLNVTPNNLLRIYAPDGVALSSTQLPPLILVSAAAVSWKQSLAQSNKYENLSSGIIRQAASCPFKAISFLFFFFPGADVPGWSPPRRPPGDRVSDAAGV